MRGFGRSSAVALLVGLAGVMPIPASQAMAQEVDEEFRGWLHIFFDAEKYHAWRSGSGGSDAFAAATSVPEKLADVSFLVMAGIAGCKAGADGNCNVTADYQLFDPSGQRVVDDPGRKVWTGAAQPVDVVVFSEEPIPAMLQSSDAPGVYRLHVVLHDNIARAKVEQERTLTLEES